LVVLARRVLGGALAAALVVSLGSASAHAEDGQLSFFTLGKQSMFLELGSGAFALIGNEQHGQGRASPEFNLDAVSGWNLVDFWGVLRVSPMVGAFVTARGSLMGYVGLHGAIPLGAHFELDPFTAVGVYGQGDGRDMGSKALFHAGLTGYYLFDSGYRAGLTFAHESNGGLFPRDHEHCVCNPSANDALVTLGVPIDKLGF
jgi:hypothetical protein